MSLPRTHRWAHVWKDLAVVLISLFSSIRFARCWYLDEINAWVTEEKTKEESHGLQCSTNLCTGKTLYSSEIFNAERSRSNCQWIAIVTCSSDHGTKTREIEHLLMTFSRCSGFKTVVPNSNGTTKNWRTMSTRQGNCKPWENLLISVDCSCFSFDNLWNKTLCTKTRKHRPPSVPPLASLFRGEDRWR